MASGKGIRGGKIGITRWFVWEETGWRKGGKGGEKESRNGEKKGEQGMKSASKQQELGCLLAGTWTPTGSAEADGQVPTPPGRWRKPLG